jgi:hypothetical protein
MEGSARDRPALRVVSGRTRQGYGVGRTSLVEEGARDLNAAGGEKTVVVGLRACARGARLGRGVHVVRGQCVSE